jgi:hypothetical protein
MQARSAQNTPAEKASNLTASSLSKAQPQSWARLGKVPWGVGKN